MYQVNLWFRGIPVPRVHVVEDNRKAIRNFLLRCEEIYILDKITWRKMS